MAQKIVASKLSQIRKACGLKEFVIFQISASQNIPFANHVRSVSKLEFISMKNKD